LSISRCYPSFLEAKASESEAEEEGLQSTLDGDAPVHKSPVSNLSNQGRTRDSQATDKNDDVKEKEVDGEQERAKAKVDLDEQHGELGDQADEDDELAEARDEHGDDQHEQVAAVGVLNRHSALAVP
jgi:hypothetical protein